MEAPQGFPGTGGGVARLGNFGAGFTDGPHRMSTVLPGEEKEEGHFRQREQHEQSYGGGKRTRHSENCVAGESGPGPRGRGPGWRERPQEGL